MRWRSSLSAAIAIAMLLLQDPYQGLGCCRCHVAWVGRRGRRIRCTSRTVLLGHLQRVRADTLGRSVSDLVPLDWWERLEKSDHPRAFEATLRYAAALVLDGV